MHWNCPCSMSAPAHVIANFSITEVVVPLLIASAEISTSGTVLTLSYNKLLSTSSVPAASDFTISAESATFVTSVSIDQDSVLLAVDRTFVQNETVRISYSPGAYPIKDVNSNLADPLMNHSVVNNSTEPTSTMNYQVAAGSGFNCALDDSGVVCWGNSANGRTAVPTTLSNPTQVSTAHILNACALDDSGVVCWGNADDGRTTVPDTLSNPTQVTAGREHTCALDDSGVVCWGNTDDGRTTVPDTLINPTHVTAGGSHTCALDDSGVCWGSNGSRGQINAPDTLQHPRHVTAGSAHTCALDDSGVICWGSNVAGQINTPNTLSNPIHVVTGATSSHTCALDDSGVVCWGDHTYGKTSVPDTLINPTQVTTGSNHTCVFDNNGVSCWGSMTTVPLWLSFDGIDESYALTVVITGNGHVSGPVGSVSPSPGIDCGLNCSEIYNNEVAVPLVATPAIGHILVGWSEECSDTSNCAVGIYDI